MKQDNNNTSYIWMDGTLVPWAQAQVHVLSYTLHYGLGSFEGIRMYPTSNGTAIFRLHEHVDRLLESCSVLPRPVPFSKQEIIDAVCATVKKNGITHGYVRPLVYLGTGALGIQPTDNPVHLAIAVLPWKKVTASALRVKTSPFIRIHPQSTYVEKKLIGNYINSILAHMDAVENGYDEALLLDYEGNIAEGPGANVCIVKDGNIQTPALGSLLPGITRDTVLAISGDLGIPAEECSITEAAFKNADEAFFTGTAVEIAPIQSIDNISFGKEAGPITRQLQEYYDAVVHGKVEKYKDWLTIIN